MGAEQIAAKQEQDVKTTAEKGAKFSAELLKQFKRGLNPDVEMKNILAQQGEKLESILHDMSQKGLISKDELSSIKDKIRGLDSYSSLVDGCNKAGAKELLAEKADLFSKGTISKGDFFKAVENISLAPDSLKFRTKGTPDLESIKADIMIKADRHGTCLHKETLNLSAKQMKKEALDAAKSVAKTAGKAAGKVAKKGAATAVIGATTGGIGFVVSLASEIVKAGKKAIEKSTGLGEQTREAQR